MVLEKIGGSHLRHVWRAGFRNAKWHRGHSDSACHQRERSFSSSRSSASGVETSQTSGRNGDRIASAFSYCAEQVRKCDYENYLCALHLPRTLRASVFALRAFNIEVATAADAISSSGSKEGHALASMRLLWWNEGVSKVFAGERVDHPVMIALSAVLAEKRLSKHWFNRLYEARSRDLEADGPPHDIAALEAYAEGTASALMYLTLEAAGVRTTAADHVASHVGKAVGLSILLRSTPYHSQRQKTYIPLDVATKHGVSQEEIYRGEVSEAMADVVLEIASVAKMHLDKARALRSTIPPASLPVMLPAVPVGLFLSFLERKGFNIFDNALRRGVDGRTPLRVQLQLIWNALRGTY